MYDPSDARVQIPEVSLDMTFQKKPKSGFEWARGQYELGTYKDHYNFLKLYWNGCTVNTSENWQVNTRFYTTLCSIIIWENGTITYYVHDYEYGANSCDVKLSIHNQNAIIKSFGQTTDTSFIYENNNFILSSTKTDFPSIVIKYLLDIDSKYYTINDDTIVEVSDAMLNANTFLTYGFDTLSEYVLKLCSDKSIRLLQWSSREEAMPIDGFAIKVLPKFPHNTVCYDPIDITAGKCVRAVAVEDFDKVSNEVLFTVSIDNGMIWLYWDGIQWSEALSENEGMPYLTLEALDRSQWALLNATNLQIRATLTDRESKIPNTLYYQLA
jgi:hypothetical protein